VGRCDGAKRGNYPGLKLSDFSPLTDDDRWAYGVSTVAMVKRMPREIVR